MTHAQYATAETLVYDPVASNRNATRAVLRSLGFHRVEFVSSPEAICAALAERSFDLLLCEVGGAEAEICSLVQSIRQGKVGNNPFLVTIITTWRRDGSIVNQAVNSGADDLLARPFSAAALGERLKVHIERRKGFVVTSEYIGPDRRRDLSRPGVEPIAVPNSLKVKAMPGISAIEAEQRIALQLGEGKRVVDAEKLRRDAQQLCAQWQVLEQRRNCRRDFAGALKRIEVLAAEIGMRAHGAADQAVGECCARLREGVAAVAACASNPVEASHAISLALQTIGEAVQTLAQSFDLSDGSDARVAHHEKLAQADARSLTAMRSAAGRAA